MTPAPQPQKSSPESAHTQSWPDFLKGAALFLALAAAIWAACETIYLRFPYLRPGSDLIWSVKKDSMAKSPLFGPSAKLRVIAFGNSRTMAGFMPAVFAGAMPVPTEAYNFGLPSDDRFLDSLEDILAHGTRPTHILLQIQWQDEAPEGPLTWLTRDQVIVHQLAPFRDLPRDLLAFAAARGDGWSRTYEQNKSDVAGVVADRGWYFIKSQSHYPGDTLPENFRLPTDAPDRAAVRSVSTEASQWRRLATLAKQYKFTIFLIPPAYRSGEYRPVTDDPAREIVIAQMPDARIIGPDYYLLSPRSFADPTHLNPAGAKAYTERLAALFRQHLAGAP